MGCARESMTHKRSMVVLFGGGEVNQSNRYKEMEGRVKMTWVGEMECEMIWG